MSILDDINRAAGPEPVFEVGDQVFILSDCVLPGRTPATVTKVCDFGPAGIFYECTDDSTRVLSALQLRPRTPEGS